MEGRSRKRGRRVRRKRMWTAALILTALLLLGGGYLVARKRTESRYDQDAVDLSLVERPKTKEELQLEVQRASERSSFRFQMNSEPVLRLSSGPDEPDPKPDKSADKSKLSSETDGPDTVNWSIINSIENRADMEVYIHLDDGRELYHSRRLKPGQSEFSGCPEIELEPGEYHAIATAYVLETGTESIVGTVTTELRLEVKHRVHESI